VAGWHAAMPPAGKWTVGGPNRAGDQAHAARRPLEIWYWRASVRKSWSDEQETYVRGLMISSRRRGFSEEAQVQAIKQVVARQLAAAMKKKKISKARMATLLKTSRTQVDRLLDTRNDITLSSLQRAAAIVGRRVAIELVRKV